MEVDNKIIELQERIYRKYSLKFRLNELNEQYFYLKDHLRELTFKLEDMDVDINKLNKGSIIHLWYDIFIFNGNNIPKIKHEYKLSHNLIDYIHSELIEVKNKIIKIEEYEKEYNKLLKEKEKISLESEKDKDEEFKKIVEEGVKYKNRIRDINEAIMSGVYLDNAFRYLLELLNKTKDWDNLDIYGRGLFMTLTKTPVFKQTNERIKKLHYLANKLVRDLKVINFYTDINIDVSRIIKYIDYFEKQLYEDIKDRNRLIKIIDYIKNSYQVIDITMNNLKASKEIYLKQLLEIEKIKRNYRHN